MEKNNVLPELLSLVDISDPESKLRMEEIQKNHISSILETAGKLMKAIKKKGTIILDEVENETEETKEETPEETETAEEPKPAEAPESAEETEEPEEPEKEPAEGEEESPEGGEEESPEETPKPVSYTHLTLPTIYSV